MYIELKLLGVSFLLLISHAINHFGTTSTTYSKISIVVEDKTTQTGVKVGTQTHTITNTNAIKLYKFLNNHPDNKDVLQNEDGSSMDGT